jgi:hypothetical protein
MLMTINLDKEQWEPIIEYIVERVDIQEAWSVEWPSHGQGAVLNAQVISSHYSDGVGELPALHEAMFVAKTT